MNLSRGAMYSRAQGYSLQTHGLPDEDPSPNTSRDNRPQVVDTMNLSRGAMYSRAQGYSLQTHGLPDEDPSPNTSRDNRPQGNAPSKGNGGAIYRTTQQFMLHTHSVPDEDPMPGSSGESRRQMNAQSKISGRAIYTKMQQYSLQTHSVPDKEPMPSTSGEHQRQVTELEEEQRVEAERRKKRVPEKRTGNQPGADSNPGKKAKKAPNSSAAAQHTGRSNQASPNELYLTALGTEDVNPWTEQQEPEQSAPEAADSTAWSRPNVESAAAPAQQARGALQHPASMYGGKSSGINMALADCLDSLSSLDPNATYKINYIPPVPARLTLTKVEPAPLPPPPLLFPYGVPVGSQRPCGDSRQTESDAPSRTVAPDEETQSDTRQQGNGPGRLTPSRGTPSRMDVREHLPGQCVPLPWVRENLQPIVKHVKDQQTTTCRTTGCQTFFPDSNCNNSGKCCPLINANRVLLRHHTAKKRGQTTVLEVDHISADQDATPKYSTPNGGRKSRSRTPSTGVRPLGQVRPPEVRSPQTQCDVLDFQQTLNLPCRDIARERNLSDSDSSSSSSYSVTRSVQNSPATSYSSYPNTPGYREKE